MLKSRLFCCIFFLLVSLCIGSEVKAGGKVITLVENFTIPASTAIDLPSFIVGNFQYASLLAISDTTVSFLLSYATEPGLYSDHIAKEAGFLFQISTGGASLQSTNRADPLQIRGSHLLSRIINNNTSPATVTIKVYLSK